VFTAPPQVTSRPTESNKFLKRRAPAQARADRDGLLQLRSVSRRQRTDRSRPGPTLFNLLKTVAEFARQIVYRIGETASINEKLE
jgi:hypothetical protein